MGYILEYKYNGESVKEYIDDVELDNNRKKYLMLCQDLVQIKMRSSAS